MSLWRCLDRYRAFVMPSVFQTCQCGGKAGRQFFGEIHDQFRRKEGQPFGQPFLADQQIRPLKLRKSLQHRRLAGQSRVDLLPGLRRRIEQQVKPVMTLLTRLEEGEADEAVADWLLTRLARTLDSFAKLHGPSSI